MTMENSRQFIESENNIFKKDSVIKLLSDGRINELNLPEYIKNDSQLLNECKERKNLTKKIESIYSKIPVSMNVEDALKNKLVSEEEINNLYYSLEELIKNDPDNNRILLYLPFELIPNKTKNPDTTTMVSFSDFYKKEWLKLLQEIDLRADFIDGDVPEKTTQNRNLPKVSKSAHIIPMLLDRGVLNIEDIFNLLENQNDKIILDSILDTLRILADKNYINKNNLNKLENSKNMAVKNVAALIKYDLNTEKKESIKENKQETIDSQEIFSLMDKEIEEETKIASNDKISIKRAKWLNDIKKEQIINKYTEILFDNTKNNEEIFQNMLEKQKLNSGNICVIIKVLEKMLLAGENKESIKKNFSKFTENSDPLVKEFLYKTMTRLKSADLLEEEYFNKNIAILGFDKYEKTIENKIKKILEELKKNKLLSNSLYPVTLLYGSQTKDYVMSNSDMDIAVFVNENIDFKIHKEITKELKKILEKTKVDGSIMEFWLEENKDNSLWIKDFDSQDNNLGDSFLTTPLTSPWYGNTKEIQNLQNKLLPTYLNLKNSNNQFDFRKIWLKDIEHSFLQYRLMHKGYKNNNLEQGGVNSKHKEEIDGESSFYDSGYRRMATKLFLERVFIPKLEK
jgi:predicted nucleotidyltransferase/Fe2+ or Zn2+ uptake regulation protein